MHPLTPAAPPIAMLHYVFDDSNDVLPDWFISRRSFLQLLDTLDEAQFKTTHFLEFNDSGRKGDISGKVILSFDDGAKHLFDFAIPELVKRDMKAVFFMPTAFIGGCNEWDIQKGAKKIALMDESDLKELVRLGMEVGSHAHRHIALRDVSDEKQLRDEIAGSKKILEDITGQPVYSFAYPFGSVPVQYKTLLKDAGYRFGVSIYQPFESRLALRRFGVYETDTPFSLRRKCSGRYRWMRKFFDVIKND